MARVAFTSRGYIEVWCGTVMVSRHRQEAEAIESLTAYAATLPAGAHEFELRFPSKSVTTTTVYTPPPVTAGVINGTVTL